MNNLYEIIDSISTDVKKWLCIKVELNDLRENHTAFGANVLLKFAESLEDVGTADKEPKLEGRSMMLMINPKNS